MDSLRLMKQTISYRTLADRNQAEKMGLRQARIELAPGYSISRVIKGGWQLAGGHGAVDERQAIADMYAFVKAGFTTFDCADIYTGVEELIGKFLRRVASEMESGELPPVQIHTKYVPDLDQLAHISRVDTEKIIDRSLRRLGVERLDLVQFAWWDYSIPRYVDVCMQLVDLQKAGKIRHIGVTNFNMATLREMIEAGAPLISNQVQYSVLDQRPARTMQAFLQDNGMSFLCYGVVAGGFLSDRYLDVDEHDFIARNRSQTKYRLIIEEFGGFVAWQRLLRVLRGIAADHGVGIAEVAAAWVLKQERVAAVIIGARNASHLQKLEKLAGLELSEAEFAIIRSVIDEGAGVAGDVYELERDREGRHGQIMKYNLNRLDSDEVGHE
jgi:aryl-alcohol dehydrogenase-like predicted oxidoreductase